MTQLTYDENRYYEEQTYVKMLNAAYVEKDFVAIKIKKWNLSYTKKLEVSIILQENLEGHLIASVIYTMKYSKKFL